MGQFLIAKPDAGAGQIAEWLKSILQRSWIWFPAPSWKFNAAFLTSQDIACMYIHMHTYVHIYTYVKTLVHIKIDLYFVLFFRNKSTMLLGQSVSHVPLKVYESYERKALLREKN